MSNTPNLGLTLMSASQAQKETVFNNLAIAFDALFKGSVISASVTTPPASPAVGDAYIVPAGSTGWPVGHDDNVAFYFNGWQYIAPPLKLRLFDVATGRFMTYQGPSTHWTNDPLSTVSVLGDLTNVTGTPADGQVLTFVAVDGHWEPRTPAFTGPLSGLSDVQVSEGATIDGMALAWNNTDHKWEPQAFIKTIPPVTFLGLSDVSHTGASSGWVLVYNETGPGAHFVAINTLETVTSLKQVGDVSYPTSWPPAPGSFPYLQWNGSAWVPSTAAVAYSWAGISDGPGAFTGNAGLIPRVNSIENKMEYVTPAQALGTSFKLLDLLDVTVGENSGQDGEVLTWSNADHAWEPRTPATGVTTLAGLTDVGVSSMEDSAHDGDVLAWHNATAKWWPVALARVAFSGAYGDLSGLPSLFSGNYADLSGKPTIPTALANLSDVTIAEGAGIDGYTLNWNNTAGRWVPTAPVTGGTGGGATALSALSDVTETSPTNGQVLTYESGHWVNADPTGGTGGGSGTLAGDTDVAISSPADGQVLAYDGLSSLWKNKNPNIMATSPSVVQSAVATAASATGLTLGAAPTAGNLLLAFVSSPGDITQGTGWAQLLHSGQGTDYAGIYFKIAGAGESPTQNPVAAGNSVMMFAIYEVSNVDFTSIAMAGLSSIPVDNASSVSRVTTQYPAAAGSLLIYAFEGTAAAAPTGVSLGALDGSSAVLGSRAIAAGHGLMAPDGISGCTATYASACVGHAMSVLLPPKHVLAAAPTPVGGLGTTYTPPSAFGFSAVTSLYGATLTDRTSGVVPGLHVVPTTGGSGENLSCALEAAPSGPFSLVMKARANMYGTGGSWDAYGPVLHNSANGNNSYLMLNVSAHLYEIDYAGGFTSSTVSLGGQLVDCDVFLHVDYDGTNVKFGFSRNGVDKVWVKTATVASFLGAITHVGVGWTGSGSASGPEFDFTHFYAGALGTAGLFNSDAIPYNVGISLTGALFSSEIMLQYILPEAVRLPAGLTGSFAKANTAATASTTVTINKNGTAIGTMTWAAAGTSATFTFASAVEFAAGDVLQLVAPATPDATLADIGISLAGTRS